MKLFYSPVSPFVRKVMVVAHELGCAARIETVRVVVAPSRPNPDLARHNPLTKLPTLVTADGVSLFDSAVIYDYLDTAGTLMPASRSARLIVARRHALADGMMEAGLACREDLHRFGPGRDDAWLAGQRRKIDQGLAWLDGEAAGFGDRLDIGIIASGVAVSWLLFRSFVPGLQAWPRLAAWHEDFARRPSMLATEPAEDAALRL